MRIFSFPIFNILQIANRPPHFIGYPDERFPDSTLILKSGCPVLSPFRPCRRFSGVHRRETYPSGFRRAGGAEG